MSRTWGDPCRLPYVEDEDDAEKGASNDREPVKGGKGKGKANETRVSPPSRLDGKEGKPHAQEQSGEGNPDSHRDGHGDDTNNPFNSSANDPPIVDTSSDTLSNSGFYPNNNPNLTYPPVTRKLPIDPDDSERIAEHKRRYNEFAEAKGWGGKQHSGESPLSPHGLPPSAPTITEEQFAEFKETTQNDASLLRQRYLLAQAELETRKGIAKEAKKELKAARDEIEKLESKRESDRRIMQAAGFIKNPPRSQNSESPTSSIRPGHRTPGDLPSPGWQTSGEEPGEFPFGDFSLPGESPPGSPHRLSRLDPPRPPNYDPHFYLGNGSAPPTPNALRFAPASIQPSATQFLYDDSWAQQAELYVELLLQSAKLSWKMSEWNELAWKAELAQVEAEQLRFEPLNARISFYQGLAAVGEVKWKDAVMAFMDARKCKGFYKEGEIVDEWMVRAVAAVEALKEGVRAGDGRTASEEARYEKLMDEGVGFSENTVQKNKEVGELTQETETLQAAVEAIRSRRASMNRDTPMGASEAESAKAIEDALDKAMARVSRVRAEVDHMSKQMEKFHADVRADQAAVRARRGTQQPEVQRTASEGAYREGVLAKANTLSQEADHQKMEMAGIRREMEAFRANVDGIRSHSMRLASDEAYAEVLDEAHDGVMAKAVHVAEEMAQTRKEMEEFCDEAQANLAAVRARGG
ncbi:hypothetical protein MMC30_009153 [Trapelia coarctata]|nr:hypothetical protein [Trapelia coarctata]